MARMTFERFTCEDCICCIQPPLIGELLCAANPPVVSEATNGQGLPIVDFDYNGNTWMKCMYGYEKTFPTPKRALTKSASDNKEM